MPEEPVVVEEPKPLTPSEDYARIKAERAAAATPEGKAAKAAADAAGAAPQPPVPEKRASGKERSFRRQLSVRDQQIGQLRAEIEALKPKPAADPAKPAAGAAPKRADFAAGTAGDEAFRAAEIQHEAKKVVEQSDAEKKRAAQIKTTIDGYNERMAEGPAKYDDWAAVVDAGKGGALSVDLGKECPSLFWAIAKSPYNADLFYAWCKDSKALQSLIDTYKSGPEGETEALVAFHRFEGRIGKEAPAAKEVKAGAEPAKKADDAPRAPKPKPSAEVSARGGAAAPDGAPPINLPGKGHEVNPAWTAWRRAQRAAR